jgi:hypothetical protein
MENKKSVLVIGIDPKWIDFSSPEFAAVPGLNAEKVTMGIQSSINTLKDLGYHAELCWTDLGNTAGEVLKTHLQKQSFDCVLIGAGIRKPDTNFNLFEHMSTWFMNMLQKPRSVSIPILWIPLLRFSVGFSYPKS